MSVECSLSECFVALSAVANDVAFDPNDVVHLNEHRRAKAEEERRTSDRSRKASSTRAAKLHNMQSVRRHCVHFSTACMEMRYLRSELCDGIAEDAHRMYADRAQRPNFDVWHSNPRVVSPRVMMLLYCLQR